MSEEAVLEHLVVQDSGLYSALLAYRLTIHRHQVIDGGAPLWGSVCQLELTDSLIDGRSVAFNTDVAPSDQRCLFEVVDTTLIGTTTSGGGLHVLRDGSEDLSLDVFISGVTVDNNGEGVTFEGVRDAIVADSTITNNTYVSTYPAPAVAGLSADVESLLLQRSRINGNTISGIAYGTSAGLRIFYGDLVVRDSVISGNAGPNSGVELFAASSGSITNTTVSGNSSTSSSMTGINSLVGSVTTVLNSTIAGNSDDALTGDFILGSTVIVPGLGGASCDGDFTTIVSLGYNYTTDASCPSFVASDVSNGADPLLGPLADNAGPTFSHLPGLLSPLLDAIPAATSALCDGTIPLDQRLLWRPSASNPACDIGAVERQATD